MGLGLANGFINTKTSRTAPCTQLRSVTGTDKGNKHAMDVCITNTEAIGQACVSSVVYNDFTASTTETIVALTADSQLFITITNTSEFYPLFFSVNSQLVLPGGDVLLPCSTTSFCIDATAINSLFFYTEAGTARAIVSQAVSS